MPGAQPEMLPERQEAPALCIFYDASALMCFQRAPFPNRTPFSEFLAQALHARSKEDAMAFSQYWEKGMEKKVLQRQLQRSSVPAT